LGKIVTSVGFVKDIVRGMILAAENPRAVGQTYFLGENRAYSSRELAKHVADALGKKTLKVRFPSFLLYTMAFFAEAVAALTKTRPLVLKRSLDAYLNSNWRFSMKKAKEELNFEAEYPLPKGLKVSAQWYKENGFL
jgi:nucleoside-diphosphate-sugar epimerase